MRLKNILNESDLKGYLAADVVDDIVKSIGSKFVSGEIKNAPNKNYIYLKLTDIKFGSGVVKMLKSQFGIDAKIDKTFGNIPSVSFASKKVVSESVNEEKVYIDYLNKAKGFKQDRIKFNSYEDAVKWARQNFDKFSPDMIKYESVNEDKYYIGYNKGRGQGTGVFKDVFSTYKDAKKEVEKIEKQRGGSYNQIAYYVADKDGKFVRESVNEATLPPVRKVVNAILKKHGIVPMKTTSTSVRGFHNIQRGGYRYEGNYFLGFYGVTQDIIDKVGAEMKKAGVKDVDVRKGIISADFTKTGLKESINEEDNKSPEEILRGLKEMAMGDLERIEDYAEMISDRMKEGQELSSWMYSQITLAVDQLNSVHDAMDGKDGVKESVNEGREVKAIQSDFNKTVAAIETELLHYKKTKGTPQEKKHVDNLKKLHPIKKKLEAELESAVSGLYRDAELKIENLISIKEVTIKVGGNGKTINGYDVDYFKTARGVYANIEIPSPNPTFDDDTQVKGFGKDEKEALNDLKKEFEKYLKKKK